MKAIDVSSYQGNIDWSKVKSSGINNSILKIMMKDLSVDTKFESNYKACIDNKINILGVYNYSYATSLEMAHRDAIRVIEILNGRKTTVILDIEDNCQKNIGNLLIDIINEYSNIITSNGNKFMIYTGQSFYNSYLKQYSSILTCPFWIAKYSNVKPIINNILWGWQYSSKGKVDGISGNVDMNEIYITEGIEMGINYASKVINVSLAEEGYLEKKSNVNLDNKTANAGSNNYTKYGKVMHDILPSIMDFPAYWCASFICWIFMTAFGVDVAKTLLCGNFNDYTVALAQQFKDANRYYKKNPQVGDVIFFKNSQRICHVGLVYKVDTTKVYTVEGNTSSASGVVANGGCVAKKSYLLSYAKIDGYGRPNYDVETTPVIQPNVTCDTDGNYTKEEFVFDVCTMVGSTTAIDALSKTITVSATTNNTHNIVILIKKYLKAWGYYSGDVTVAKWDSMLTNGVKQYQVNQVGAKSGDGIISAKGATWKHMLL